MTDAETAIKLTQKLKHQINSIDSCLNLHIIDDEQVDQTIVSLYEISKDDFSIILHIQLLEDFIHLYHWSPYEIEKLNALNNEIILSFKYVDNRFPTNENNFLVFRDYYILERVINAVNNRAFFACARSSCFLAELSSKETINRIAQKMPLSILLDIAIECVIGGENAIIPNNSKIFVKKLFVDESFHVLVWKSNNRP